MQEQKQRNIFLDFIKGIAIIAVALYHFGGGVLPYGYLGVDIFFVVGGFFLLRSLIPKVKDGSFQYWKYLSDKLVRLWPLVLLAIAVSLLLGFFLMLPDDYENLAESAIASSFFGNNILQCITTKNYWNVVNLYKPLMHLWYVGVLLQAYVVIPIILIIFEKIFKNNENGVLIGIVAITVISLVLYLMPQFSTAWKFYYLPFRLFEMTAGGLLVYVGKIKYKGSSRFKTIGTVASSALLVILLCSQKNIISASFMLILTVVASIVFICCTLDYAPGNKLIYGTIRCIARIGQSSYSIYIWHQVIVAIMFYSIFQKHSFISFIVFIVLTIILSTSSYLCIEKPLEHYARNHKKVLLGSSLAIAVIISIASFGVYRNAGVVRDIPELGISTSDVHRNMHAEYCDRPYTWNKEFEDDGDKHILIIGNSFGRDWANILYEWDDSLDLSYIYYPKKSLQEYSDRIRMADIVFYAMGPDYEGVPEEIQELVGVDKLFIIGNKNFGESNGIIYAKRNSETYFNQTVEVPLDLMIQNEQSTALYNDHYVDMIEVVRVDDRKVRVFTDEHMFISQDCKHLTQAGAQFYADRIDIGTLLN